MKPLERVVDSVLEPWETGVASPRVKGDCLLRLTALMAVLERRAVCRFSASRREAIADARSCWGGARAGRTAAGGWDDEVVAAVPAWRRVRKLRTRLVPGREGATANQRQPT